MEFEETPGITRFKEWIRSLESDAYRLNEEDEKEWLLETDYAGGHIVFHPQDIIELMIVSLKTGENEFYLHFQLHDEDHAHGLVNEMIKALLEMKDARKLKVLLTCTSGLTTSYFASQLTEAAASLHLDYEFAAVPFNKIYEKGFDYDVILLAPQVHYEYAKTAEIFKRKTVMKIPAAAFGGYKSGDVIEMIMAAMLEKKETDPETEAIRSVFDNDRRILCIALVNHLDRFRIGYCIYDHGKRTLDKEVIKENHSFKDIEDLLDYVMARHENIDAISIAYPGIVYHGRLYHPDYGFDNSFNMGRYLQEKYHHPVFLINDVNAIALGYFAMHEDCDDMVFYFQPRGIYLSGAAIIRSGRLERGWKSSAGEVGRLIPAMVEDPETKIMVPEGALEIVSKALLSFITTSAPEKFIVYSELTPDVNEIRDYISRYIPEEYIPEIHMTDRLKSYMLPGAMIHALDVMKRVELDPDYYKKLDQEHE
jgi:cellobiose-specific phosphotransferase system component IIB